VILWRVLARDPGAAAREPGGALFFPRPFQGQGRHDNPARYGCLYLAADAVSGVVEAIARFRGAGEIGDEWLVRNGRRLAIAELELTDAAELIDLDEPSVLARERLRPSEVGTHSRRTTQAQAEGLFDAHPRAAGIRWWSTFESTWMNVTLFDRASRQLRAQRCEPLTLAHPAVVEAAEFLGLA
jgi:RES domain